ncbi:amidohydrolase [Flavobacterium litorale]|uniref:Amidohydrolase n=1 Tax=Flavobacterium litorale TaxID=2856519 RepID=A0ABX8V995_9FLAO|nr:amidohydrolase [Flavobacterium litorale]QYJ67390.1 amidohydrolase [Flavobacterium litorale]
MEELTALRHYLHKHPEVSQNEYKTQEYMLNLLGKLNADKVEKTANTGILVTFKGKAVGKNILLRADIDALPIQETISTTYKSNTEGVSHKCGHDGHTTIMYGVAQHFAAQRPEKGNVYLLFQPAEENGWGARNVVADGTLKGLNIDMVFALHNLPGYTMHSIVCKTGSFTSSVVSLAAHFKGYTAHAAEPWNGRNPAKAMSQYMLEALALNMEDKPAYVTVTPVHTAMGEKAYGISAGEGSVHLTVRADSNQRLDAAMASIKSKATEIAKDEELEVSFEIIEPFESNQNHNDAVAVIQKAAKTTNSEYNAIDDGFRFGEDFGIFTNLYPGAMFGVGSGKDCFPLHHPAYDYPDEITQTGIKMFTTIQKEAQA